MITQDQIDQIQKLKSKRYSQAKVAQKLSISRSTVARYWPSKKESITSRLTSKKFGLDDLFRVEKCKGCGLIYPKPKFLPLWKCPGCKKDSGWNICWYEKDISKP